MPGVGAPTNNTAKMEPSKKCAGIDQIAMMVEELLEKTCKWKEENDAEAEESKKTTELTKLLSWVEEAIKKARPERDMSLRANDKLGQVVAKKDTALKKVRTELMKVQAFVMKYLMKEEELIRENAKAKEEVESMWKAHGKYTIEVNSLHYQLKHAKKEWKEEAAIFE